MRAAKTSILNRRVRQFLNKPRIAGFATQGVSGYPHVFETDFVGIENRVSPFRGNPVFALKFFPTRRSVARALALIARIVPRATPHRVRVARIVAR